MKSYYQNVFDSNAKEAKKILDFLSKNGMSEIVSKIKYK